MAHLSKGSSWDRRPPSLDRSVRGSAMIDRAVRDRTISDHAFADHAIGDRALGNRAIRDRALGALSVRDRTISDHAITDLSIGDRALGNRAIRDRALGALSVRHRTISDRAITDPSIIDRAVRDRAVRDRAVRDHSVTEPRPPGSGPTTCSACSVTFPKPPYRPPLTAAALHKVFRVAIFATALLTAAPLPAQTLQQAETLWKARRYQEANEVFRVLVAAEPKNPLYRVRWGRMYLEHWQGDIAGQLFDEALKLKPDDAEAVLGQALLAAESYGGNATELARKALSIDPKLVEAQELLARLALEDDDKAKAADAAKKALALDPASVQGKAILAVIDWLADKKDSPWDPHTARGYETAGHFFMLNRRYEESVAAYRQAIQLDPELYTARSQLGINLMRLGQNDEAYQQLKTCWDNGFQDQATKNSLSLMDKYKDYVTFKTDRTTLKLYKKEAELLHPYFESEMLRAIATYEKKYRLKLTEPVQVEVYPNHEDFAVRTLGMPGLGALGVTFGYSIAMDSPSGRPPGSFHWDSTLWHEMSHVFTLTMTNFRVPRWFTEGLAVHEETAASPEWGDRLGPEELAAVKNHHLLPITQLDRGFIHPVSPTQIMVSYFQAGKICDYIDQKWGWDTLLAMLHDFAHGDDTATVVRKQLKIEPVEFDQRFFAALEMETKTSADNLERWKDAVKQIAKLSSDKNYDGVIKLGLEWRDKYLEYVEAGSIYEFLAEAYRAKGDTAAAAAQLERYVHIGGRNPETIKLLAKELTDLGEKKEAAEVLDRLNYIYPMDKDLHQRLGELWFDQGNAAGAVREFRALVAHDPIDPAAAHFDLARAYNLNRQPEQAKDELVAALETAPGFRPAQKLLLELSK